MIELVLPDPNKVVQRIKTNFDDRSDFYFRSYPALLKIAGNTELDRETRILQLACAAYGWMPTIPKQVSLEFDIDEVMAMSSHDDALRFVADLSKPLINNSWVGTSKVLHFINPSHFPIWDSRIALHFHSKKAGANNQQRYLNYCDRVYIWNEEQPDYGSLIAKAIETQYHYTPTNIRCIELALFVSAPKNTASTKPV